MSEHGQREAESPFRGFWHDGWYVVPYYVQFRDIDAFGHVNNAVYFSYFEWGRTQLWFDLVGWGGATDIGFIVARAECDFRRSIAMESIEILTRPGEVRRSSFDFHCEIRKSGSGETAAIGKVVVVLYDWVLRSKIEVSDELRRRLEHAGRPSADSPRPGAPPFRGDRRSS